MIYIQINSNDRKEEINLHIFSHHSLICLSAYCDHDNDDTQCLSPTILNNVYVMRVGADYIESLVV